MTEQARVEIQSELRLAFLAAANSLSLLANLGPERGEWLGDIDAGILDAARCLRKQIDAIDRESGRAE